MSYRLRDDLSFCEVEAGLIFLDIQNDRYFRLTGPMERALLAYLERHEDANIDSLIDCNVLTNLTNNGSHVPASEIVNPQRSAMEQLSTSAKSGSAIRLDVFTIVASTWLWLKTRGLKNALSAMAAYREHRAPQCQADEQQAMEAAATFRHARLFVPVETCCLLDSISMVKFLAKHAVHATLVFGVTGDPFSAHCWVQAGDVVLNDSIGNVYSHTPIRAI